MEFKVSVIIPLFNCESFIEKSVKSAISCLEVGEVIIIDDGSTDSSFSICKKLQKESEKISLYTHPGRCNKGPSASRNLGILNARHPFVAFLDADDWYLELRFKNDKELFESNRSIDAAYSCTILEENLGKNEKRYGVQSNPSNLWGSDLSPIEFYKSVLENRIVLFDTNGITIRKDFLLKNKLFDERLFLHQDTELWNRLMRSGIFVASQWENPVAIIRKHGNNRISNRSADTHLKMLAVQIDNIGISKLYNFEINILYLRILRERSKIIKSHWRRRIYFYIQYLINQLNKKKILEDIRRTYAFV
ncbi:glycosyltransferase involved in cell wall biosynthesis [Algoriphagus iocasae]|uniref:Glycosyltransferase involved in cell wall biosynthesis n=1 Tax=Algoriphagus iocasae TaxID=1836499 RepID=A0A841MHS4_9BACT|nr:glycosyltransferase family 2 protein [Algoriphagus iocasae]MBB6327822.1 glycosyltransferase involved in cell wall biosynthesis [Algoriphagus iocasae]